MKFIIIAYDPKTADTGSAIDLYAYLVNEFENHKISTTMVEAPTPERALNHLRETDPTLFF